MEKEPTNLNEEPKNEPKQEDNGPREMMPLPDGTLADVTGKTPEEKREILESYKNN